MNKTDKSEKHGILIPQEVDYLIQKEKRKDSKERIIKVYNALIYKKGNKNGYFDCPSEYLKKVNVRYFKVINSFIENGIIQYYSKNTEETCLFDRSKDRRKKYYATDSGICMKYKFNIDITTGIEYKLKSNFDNIYNNEKWFHKTKYSLLQLGFSIDELFIKRDNFSRRLHTNITGHISESISYKKLMSGGEYYAIDSKTSQPRLLWLKLKEIGLQDPNLNYIFDNDIDFYEYVISRIPVLRDRKSKKDQRVDAKELFASWLNGTGYLEPDKVEIRDIFPVANTFIKNYKTASYKDACKYIQYLESKTFIDHLLNDIPLDFCLSVHDSLIVRKKDAEFALNWCKEQEPNLRFELEEVKEK